MRCKFPYNENFVVAIFKKHAGGNGNVIINFAWPNGININNNLYTFQVAIITVKNRSRINTAPIHDKLIHKPPFS